MSLPEYLKLNGVEILNNARVAAYSTVCDVPRVRPEATCPSLVTLLGATYVSPAIDGAPWYDPARPESGDFAGILCLSMAGLDNALISRPVVDLAGDGVTFGISRRQARTIVVSGWLLGATCCATAYGLKWYSQTLAQVGCDGQVPCPGSDALFYNCCPVEVGEEGEAHYRRTLHRVSFVDGINIIGRKGRACGSCGCSEQLNVEFTLVAGDPYAYVEPVILASDVAIDGTGECVTWTLGDCQDCVDVSVAQNPDCPPGGLPPKTPTLPADCGCLPVEVKRVCLSVDASDLPMFADAALVFSITAGTTPLHNAVVTVYEGDDCDAVGECDILSQFIVSYTPATRTVTVDAATRTLTVTTATGVADASVLVTGTSGSPFTFPVLRCAPLCICVDVPGDYEGATFSASFVSREV